MANAAPKTPIVQFYRLIEQARPPQRADRSAAGTLPTRAFRYCDAVTTASGFGWWIFPPMDMQFVWDGTDIFWNFDGVPDWLPLSPSAQFPGQSARFDQAAPAELEGCSPPFLTALPEPGALQIWTGLIARTAPDWSLLVRAPANLPNPGGYVPYEGVVETDQWFGPLFVNIRFTRSNVPVRLRNDFPIAQIQPLPNYVYSDAVLDSSTFTGSMDDFTARDWDDYNQTVVVPNMQAEHTPGAYAVRARKRRAGVCPFASAAKSPEAAPA